MNEDNIYEDWVPLNKREKLSYGRIFAIACCNLIQGLSYNIISITVKPFLVRLGFKGITENFIFLNGSIVGFVTGPLLGVFSDRLMFKYGRRRIFIIIGTFLIVISFLLLAFYEEIGKFLSKDNPIIAQKVIYIISVILSYLSVNIVQQSSRVLCSDVTPPKQQSYMAGICQFYNCFAPLASNLLTVYLPEIKGLSFLKFNLIFTFTISFIAMIISCSAAREEPIRIRPQKVNPFSQIYRAFKELPKPLSRVIIPFFFASAAIFPFIMQLSDFMGTLFEGSQKTYNDGLKHSMLCLALYNAVQLLYSFVSSRVIEVVGMKCAMVVGNSLICVCLCLFLFVNKGYPYFAIVGCLGFAMVTLQTVPYAVAGLVVEEKELACNFAIINCACVVGQQVANFGLGILVECAFRKDDFKVRKKIGFASFFGAVAAIASFWIIQPSAAEIGRYEQIPGNYDGEGPIAD